jgi:import inner membrane translocase subunit TIM22
MPPYDAFNPVMESCAVKAAMGTVGGWGMGILLGLFMGALGGEMSQNVYLMHKCGKEPPTAPILDQMRVSYRAVGKRALGMGASFATITAVFSGIECVVEKYRGKHDVVNGAVSGCAAGAALSAKSGPATACMGCVGFAAFSVAIEAVMGPH